jgi:hypothetical protein
MSESNIGPLARAAVAMIASESAGKALIARSPDYGRLFDPWPEMDALAAALDDAAPGWREMAAAIVATEQPQELADG